MVVARLSPTKLAGRTTQCIRRYLSTSPRLLNDKASGNRNPAPPLSSESRSSPFPPPAPNIPPVQRNTTEHFASLLNDMLSNTLSIPASAVRETNDAENIFTPATLSQMPVREDSSDSSTGPPILSSLEETRGYYHIHAVSVTRNLLITVTNHLHNPVFMVSAGRLKRYKHTRRGLPEAAYDTTTLAFQTIREKKLQVNQLEIVMKGYGSGRRGFLTALSGPPGDFLRDKIVRVTDSTPLRIGGVRPGRAKRR